MKLPPDVIRYLLVGQVIIPSFINAGITLGIGWITFRQQATVTVWVLDKGAVTDFLGACYLLPAITCLIATPIVRGQVARGQAASLTVDMTGGWVRLFRGGPIWRATKFGLSGLITLIGPVMAGWNWFGSDSIATFWFLLIKVAFATLLGCVVTPLIAIVAMTDAPKSHDPEADSCSEI
jgi:hypothetical protein